MSQEARKAAAEIDPDIPLANLTTMQRYTGAGTRDMFYYTAVLGAFALAATLLAAIGAYGVMSYHVAQRTREIGIRMALGARPWEIFRLVGAGATRIILAGLAAGMAGAPALTRLLASPVMGSSAQRPVDVCRSIFGFGVGCGSGLRRTVVAQCPLESRARSTLALRLERMLASTAVAYGVPLPNRDREGVATKSRTW